MGNISFKEYSIFCIGKIWVDWPGMDLSNYPRSRFGPSEPGFYFGLIWRGLSVAWSPPFLWAWRVGYWAHFFIPINCPPSPCVRIAWARAVILPATVAISTCLAWKRAN